MTPEQLAEIEQRWADNEVTMQTINDFNLLLAEVRQLNRLRESVIEREAAFKELIVSAPTGEKVTRWLKASDTVRKYLESEVADE